MILRQNKKMIGFGSLILACALMAPSFGSASTLREVPVASRDILRGHVLTLQDLKTQKMDLKRMPRGIVLEAENLLGLEAQRHIRSGKPIRHKYLRTPPHARSGEDVTIFFQQPGLQLKATGRALEDGQKGDIIRVMNDASKSVIKARITGNGEVTVR